MTGTAAQLRHTADQMAANGMAGGSGFLGRSSVGFLSSPQSLAQRHEQNKVKWAEVLQRKELQLQSRHKRMRDNMARLQKHEKEKL